MTSIRRIGVAARYCDVAMVEQTAYFSGYVPENSAGETMETQVADVLAQIDESLAEIGSHKAHILTATIWLADMATFEAMNSVWDEWVEPGQAPARVCVQSALANPDYALEIQITAAL